MRRSRKKQNASAASREENRSSAATVPTRRQQPPPEVLQQQRKKHHDEVTNLTTKNYRLAKELADLRLKHRDECKNVTKLTMENMNLASRCREAISHVAMLKKELAMQQKRTAQALASQREQTKRMADNLTNSFISFSSPDRKSHHNRDGSSSSSSINNSNHNKTPIVSKEEDEDDNVMRLVSSTPSPNRVVLRSLIANDVDKDKDDDDDGETKSYSNMVIKASTKIPSETKMPSSPTEETRDSSASTATNNPTSDLDEDDKVPESIALASSTLNETPENEKENLGKNEKKQKQKLPFVYSTPKISDRSQSIDRDVLFPFSASPQVFNKSNPNRVNRSYDEEFPSDKIEQNDSTGDGKNTNSQRQLNLMNSIDAFEQSFSIDFPESFTPKENNKGAPSSGSGQKIYNPFFATPEKRKQGEDSYVYITPKEEKKTPEPLEKSDIEYKTPPKSANNAPTTTADNAAIVSDEKEQLPKRPGKVTPSAARARYERALSSSRDLNNASISNDAIIGAEKTSSSESDNSPTALFRRIQQKKRLDMNLEGISKGDGPVSESPSPISSSDEIQQPRTSIVDIVDSFEQTASENRDGGKEQKSSSSRFQGPIRSLRRRSVKTPISYAEPALNTKLRRGDTFFPKNGPMMTGNEADSDGQSQNQAMNVIPPAAVVSP